MACHRYQILDTCAKSTHIALLATWPQLANERALFPEFAINDEDEPEALPLTLTQP